MAEPIVISGAASGDLEPMPIKPAWILRGDPAAKGKLLATAADKLAYIMVWECTPGEFEWHYNVEEETIYLLEGEVFISADGAPEKRVGPGDIVVFPPGTSTVWRITRPVRKIAVLRKHMPLPLGLATRAWNKLMRKVAALSPRPAASARAGGLLPS